MGTSCWDGVEDRDSNDLGENLEAGCPCNESMALEDIHCTLDNLAHTERGTLLPHKRDGVEDNEACEDDGNNVFHDTDKQVHGREFRYFRCLFPLMMQEK